MPVAQAGASRLKTEAVRKPFGYSCRLSVKSENDYAPDTSGNATSLQSTIPPRK